MVLNSFHLGTELGSSEETALLVKTMKWCMLPSHNQRIGKQFFKWFVSAHQHVISIEVKTSVTVYELMPHHISHH